MGPRPVAMSMGSLSSWFCNFLIGMTFPILQKSLGASVFVIFAVVCVLLAILLKFYMPETRGKDTSEIAIKVAFGFKTQPLDIKLENLNGFWWGIDQWNSNSSNLIIIQLPWKYFLAQNYKKFLSWNLDIARKHYRGCHYHNHKLKINGVSSYFVFIFFQLE